jgi:hypothetical protein
LKSYCGLEHRDVEAVVIDAVRIHLEGFYPSVPQRLRVGPPLAGDTPLDSARGGPPAADPGLTAA